MSRSDRDQATQVMPWAFLAAACLGAFATTSSGSARAPFIIDMARDLDVSLPMVANLFGLTSVSWGITSFLAGTGSDRWGRRPFLILGPLALTLALIATALSDSYWSVTFWIVVAGGCSGTFTGVYLAEVSARVENHQRGRALGWVMAGQSLTLLVGVPLAAYIGATIGWRGVQLTVAALAAVAALAMFATTRPTAAQHNLAVSAKGPSPSLRTVMSGPVLRLMITVVAERICFGLAAVYFATFLQMTHQLSLRAVALPLATYAVGNILGTLLGGQFADRLPNRRLTFAIAILASGVVAVVLFSWAPSLAVTTALGFAYALCNAICRPSLMASIAEVPPEIRGTVMGLNGTFASLGWLGAAALGGWILTSIGFTGFGPLVAILAVASAALALSTPNLQRS